MRVDNVPGELLDEAVREPLFGLHEPYAMPAMGYVDDVKRLGVDDLTAFYRRFTAQQRRADRGRRCDGRGGADARRDALGPIPARQVEPRHRPAEGGTGLPQAWRAPMRASPSGLEPRFHRAVLSRR